ncbi:MAG: hypothetical protein ACKVPX_14130 [Myxococcaceae bacterium]
MSDELLARLMGAKAKAPTVSAVELQERAQKVARVALDAHVFERVYALAERLGLPCEKDEIGFGHQPNPSAVRVYLDDDRDNGGYVARVMFGRNVDPERAMAAQELIRTDARLLEFLATTPGTKLAFSNERRPSGGIVPADHFGPPHDRKRGGGTPA